MLRLAGRRRLQELSPVGYPPSAEQQEHVITCEQTTQGTNIKELTHEKSAKQNEVWQSKHSIFARESHAPLHEERFVHRCVLVVA